MNLKDKWAKVLLAGILSIFLVCSVTSCAFMNSLFEDKVVTTENNVKEEFKPTIIPAPTEGIISDEHRKKLEETGSRIVLVDKNAVVDSTKAVEVTNPGKEGLGNLIDMGLGVANTLVPGVAVLEGLGLLFSQRKRQHYIEAVKAITPYDGDVAVKDAIVSVARAMGLAHSSETSKEVFVAESKKVG